MEYKVLINLFVPEIENNYEMYVPINKTIDVVSSSMIQLINDLTGGAYPVTSAAHIYNRHTGALYPGNALIRDTDIRNGTELVMIS